ncbi:MAG: hypothetical protein ACRC6T_00585 [Sarcina sp.]
MKGKKIVCALGVVVSISGALYINNLYEAYKGDKRATKLVNESQLAKVIGKDKEKTNIENYFLIDEIVENEKVKVKLKDAFVVGEYVFVGFEYDSNLELEDFKEDKKTMYNKIISGKTFSLEPQKVEIVYGEKKLDVISNGVGRPYNKQMLTMLGGGDKISADFCKTKEILVFKLPEDYKENDEIEINLSSFLLEGNMLDNELKLEDEFNTSIKFSLNGIKKEEPIVKEVNAQYTLEKDGFEVLEYEDYGVISSVSIKCKDVENKLPKVALVTDITIKEPMEEIFDGDKKIYLFETGTSSTVGIDIYPHMDKSQIINIE